jgi:hypothetical protein
MKCLTLTLHISIEILFYSFTVLVWVKASENILEKEIIKKENRLSNNKLFDVKAFLPLYVFIANIVKAQTK